MFRYLSFILAKLTWPLRFITRHLSYKSCVIFFIVLIIGTSLRNRIQEKESLNIDIPSKSSSNQDDDTDTVECHFPQLSLSNHDLKFTDYKIIQPVCHSPSFPISIDNYTVRLTQDNLDCTAFFYLGQGDRHYQQTPIALSYDASVLLLSDHFTVRCRLFRDVLSLKSRLSHATMHYISIRHDSKVRQRLAVATKQKDDLNILILSLDSVSRLQFERMLPKTFAYITEKLDGIVLKGYNILGDGTPAQIIPILTGMQERELPSTLHSDKNGSFVDVYPFIWNQFRDQGYVTGYAEDGPGIGIWTLRLKGFYRTPTDHYMTPFYRLPVSKSFSRAQNSYCRGGQTSFEFFLSYIRQFWASYSTDKKFFFGFFKQYTHDGYAYGSLLDASILDLLHTLNKSQELERTAVIVMTDHGARFSAALRTPQATIEERLPFMSFILPTSFRQKYPHAISALRTNVNRFTTPFDVHATLLSLLNPKTINSSNNVTLEQRNISLFDIIPAQRTCAHIKLAPHWCSCLQWKEVNSSDMIIKRAAEYSVSYINQFLSAVEKSLCHPLELDSIRAAQMYRTSNSNSSAPLERGVEVLAHWNTANDIVFYQITFETKPNGAIYEATIQYTNQTDSLSTDLTHISRINAYKSSADCIVRTYPHLRKFCYCIK